MTSVPFAFSRFSGSFSSCGQTQMTLKSPWLSSCTRFLTTVFPSKSREYRSPVHVLSTPPLRSHLRCYMSLYPPCLAPLTVRMQLQCLPHTRNYHLSRYLWLHETRGEQC